MDAQHVLPWETWATKSHGDPWIKALWQLLHLISPVYAIHSSADKTRQGCPSSAQGSGGWRPWARRAPRAQEKQGCWARLGVNYCSCPAINTSRALEIRREMFSAAQGPSSVCYSPKSYTKFGERNSLEGQRRRGEFFPKATFLVFSSNPFEFSLS